MTESLEIRTQKFLRNAEKINMTPLSTYKNNKTKVLMKCNVCGAENMMLPYNISAGKSCKDCAMERFYYSRKFNIDIFKDRVKEVSGNDYKVVGNYKNADTKIEMIHVVCDKSFYITPNKFYHLGRRCPHCSQKSNPEKEIYGLLKVKNIVFQEQYTMDDCKNVLCLRFDFALDIRNELILIEYNGRQHFESVDIFGGEDYLSTIKKNDKIKKEYCDKKGIKLHYIDYTQNIKEELNNILNNYANPEPS